VADRTIQLRRIRMRGQRRVIRIPSVSLSLGPSVRVCQ
jgi:hypothetical protein